MVGLIMISFISLLSGYCYLFRPEVIIRLSRLGDRLVTTDHELIRHRMISGVAMLVAGAVMFYVGMYYL